MDFFATILLTALALGSVLFLLSVGLSLTMGLMGVLNLAHGALFMVGAYLGAQMAQVGADFWSSAIIGGLGAGLVGLILDRGLLRHLHRRFDDQVLVTFGAIFILTNVSRWIWGSWPKIGHLPEYLAGSFLVGDYSFPFHRVVLIGVGAMALLVVLGLQKKTHIGRAVRAGLDNKEMLMALGVRYEAIATGVFAFGAFMAGFAGYIASPMMGISLRLGLDALLLALVVVIVGGTGSVVGAFVGAMLIAFAHTFIAVYYQEFAMFGVWSILILVLLLRPSGIVSQTR